MMLVSVLFVSASDRVFLINFIKYKNLYYVKYYSMWIVPQTDMF